MDGAGGFVRGERQRRGWTPDQMGEQLRQLAERQGEPDDRISGFTVSGWEEGKPIKVRHIRLLSALLDVPFHDLVGLTVPGQQAQWLSYERDGTKMVNEGDPTTKMLRRDFLRYTAALVASSGLAESERLVFALSNYGRVDHRLLADLEAVTLDLAGQMWTVPPGRLLPTLLGHLHLLGRLASGLEGDPRQAQLRQLAGETAVVASRLEYQQGEQGEAVAHALLAARLAIQTGDSALLAQARGLQARAHSLIHGKPSTQDGRAAVGLLDGALVTAPPGAAHLRAWLLTMRGHERAAMGQDRESDQDIDAAEKALGGARERPRGYLSPWERISEVDSVRGSAAALLGRSFEAVGILQDVLDSEPRMHPTQRTGTLVALASAYLQPPADVERACELLGEALTVAHDAGLTEKVNRVVQVRTTKLDEHYREPAVVRLDDQILAIRQA